MSDPLTTVIGTQVVVEGIKFLYGQATEALKRLRDKQDNPDMPSEIVSENTVPNIFIEKPETPVIRLHVVEKLANDLDEVSSHLTRYAEGVRKVDPNDTDVVKRLDALRQLLEQVYDHRLTFKGEVRENDSEPNIIQQLNINTHSGKAIGVHVDGNSSNQSVRQQTIINEVTPSAEVTGVKLSA